MALLRNVRIFFYSVKREYYSDYSRQGLCKYIKCEAHIIATISNIYVYIEIIVIVCSRLAVHKIAEKHFKGTIISHLLITLKFTI